MHEFEKSPTQTFREWSIGLVIAIGSIGTLALLPACAIGIVALRMWDGMW